LPKSAAFCPARMTATRVSPSPFASVPTTFMSATTVPSATCVLSEACAMAAAIQNSVGLTIPI
jgi:hypothetical protein